MESNTEPTSSIKASKGFAVAEQFPEIGYAQSITMEQTQNQPLYEFQSKYQHISMYSNPHYGKVMVLDGVVQVTERDGDAYNEMMAHVPLMEHKEPKRVLVIGGGDGYVVSEILKHPTVTQVDVVELDQDVVEACKVHFPQWASSFDDPRVHLHIADGAHFVQNATSDTYDVVIQDSSDPHAFREDGKIVDLPSSVLFKKTHFQHVKRILRGDDGIFSFQAECFGIPSDLDGICKWRKDALEVGFDSVKYGSLYISSYPLGQIGFLLCKKKVSDRQEEESWWKSVTERYEAIMKQGKGTTYYWPEQQRSCFTLPLWVHKKVYDEDEK